MQGTIIKQFSAILLLFELIITLLSTIIQKIIIYCLMKGILSLASAVLFLLLLFFSDVILQDSPEENHPGLNPPYFSLIFPYFSMSADLSIISQAKDAYLSTIVKRINGLMMPNITLSGGDGHVKQNRIFIKQKSRNVKLFTNETRNSYSVKMRNLYLFMRSQDFRYNMWFIPIKATLDVELGSTSLDFEVELSNKTVYYIDPHTGQNLTRVVPQIEVPRCVLTMDPSKIKFNIGGSLIASVADVILPMFTRIITLIIEKRIKSLVQEGELPAMFNDPILESNGMFQLGDMFGIPGYENATLDYQVERFGIEGSQLQVAINGTFFNNKTTGYRVLPVPLPLKQPFHDNSLNSTWQLFISTYLLEHFTTTLLDEAPFPFFYEWNFLNNTMFDLTTSSMEAFFPMLTSQYGDNIPIDLLFEFPRVWSFKSSRDKRRLSFNLDFRAKAYLHLPDNGGKQYIGMLEWYDGEAWIEIVSEGMFLIGNSQFRFDLFMKDGQMRMSQSLPSLKPSAKQSTVQADTKLLLSS